MNIQGPDYRDRKRCISCGALKLNPHTLFCGPCAAVVEAQMDAGQRAVSKRRTRPK